MALTAAAQMCSGVGKSGSPTLKSKTLTPWLLSWRARAAAARVAEGCTADAMRESATGAGPLDIDALSFRQGEAGSKGHCKSGWGGKREALVAACGFACLSPLSPRG